MAQRDEDFWAGEQGAGEQGVEHFIFGQDGEEVVLSRDGEVADFRAGDRVIYGERCYPHLRGVVAVVIGFNDKQQIWTQPDGQTDCHSTPEEFAKASLIKIG